MSGGDLVNNGKSSLVGSMYVTQVKTGKPLSVEDANSRVGKIEQRRGFSAVHKFNKINLNGKDTWTTAWQSHCILYWLDTNVDIVWDIIESSAWEGCSGILDYQKYYRKVENGSRIDYGWPDELPVKGMPEVFRGYRLGYFPSVYGVMRFRLGELYFYMSEVGDEVGACKSAWSWPALLGH